MAIVNVYNASIANAECFVKGKIQEVKQDELAEKPSKRGTLLPLEEQPAERPHSEREFGGRTLLDLKFLYFRFLRGEMDEV
jgi:hypothetical protein